MYSVLCTVYYVLCTVYFVQCTVYSVLCTVHCVQCTMYSALFTLTHECLKVHGGVPIVLCIFVDPLEPRINCLVIRE